MQGGPSEIFKKGKVPSYYYYTQYNLMLQCIRISVFTSNDIFLLISFNLCAYKPNCYVYKSYIVYIIKSIYGCIAIYMGLHCIWQLFP